MEPANQVPGSVPSYRLVLGTRISAVVDLFDSRIKAAEIACVSTDQLKRYTRGESEPPVGVVMRLAKAKDINLEWLLYGKGSMHAPEIKPISADQDGFVYLPLHENVSISAGNGCIVWDESSITSLAFRETFIRSELRANPANLRLARTNGDSMERLLYSGDVIMVDTSITTLLREGLYVFRLDGSISVKWLYSLPGGVIRVVSENAEKYPPYDITPAQMETSNFHIIGFVRWWSHVQR